MSNQIKINVIPETSCQAFDPSGQKIGTIFSYLSLLDFRLQINKDQLEGYYLMWNKIRIDINKNGMLSIWPKGFYDDTEKFLDQLFIWE